MGRTRRRSSTGTRWRPCGNRSLPLQPPPVLTDDQLKAIFANDLLPTRSFSGVRYFSILATLADTGMRVGELVGMTVDDVDFDNGTIDVTGKGRRRRRVAFGARAGKALLAELRGPCPPQARWLYLPCCGLAHAGQLREAAVTGIVKGRGAGAGVEGVFPHLFRHTMAHRFR